MSYPVPPTAALPNIEWREKDGALVPFLVGSTKEVAWTPQPGSQELYLSCNITEVLYEGTRGPGKTEATLMVFGSQVGVGWGSEWRGVIFRRTYPELSDIINKSRKLFPRIFPGAKYNAVDRSWRFPDGEMLMFRHCRVEDDYNHYHGHEFTFIGWEELTTWPDDTCFKALFSCLRSSVPGIPLWVRATANPHGVGHNWVKKRYKLPVSGGNLLGDVIRNATDLDGNPEPERVAIHGDLSENKVLLYSQPNYVENLIASASSPEQLRAWLYGDWDIVAGGMLDDVWDKHIHMVPNFPLKLIPRGWKIYRSYDHGSSKPFSVGWWARANGEVFEYEGHIFGKIRGDIYRIAEWYGCGPKDNEGIKMDATRIAKGILERESDYGILGRVKKGPADTNIFDGAPNKPTQSVATDMESEGVSWERADKGPGSRKAGWEQLRKYLVAATTYPREKPGLFVLERCHHFKRTMPVLPRDKKDPDDVDTESEDHIADETRYFLRWKPKVVKQGTSK